MRKWTFCLVLLGIVMGACLSVNAVSWTVETAMLGHTYELSLAVDSQGDPHMVYRNDSGLYYGSRSSSGWSFRPVVTGGSEKVGPMLMMDANDSPCIGYRDTQTDSLKYATWTGSAWDIDSITGGVYGASLAQDENGKMCFVYARASGSLYFARLENGVWNSSLVYQSWSQPYSRIRLAFDDANNAHVIYNESTRLYYGVQDGSTWSFGNSIQSGGAYMTSLAVTDDGTPYVSYYLDSGAGNQQMRFATMNDGTWNTQTVEALHSWSNSIGIDANGNPCLVYDAQAPDDVKFAKLDGGTWSTSVIDGLEGDAGDCLALGIDGDGNYHAIYSYEGPSGSFSVRYAFAEAEVPEPATIGLMAAGALSLMGAERLRRRV